MGFQRILDAPNWLKWDPRDPETPGTVYALFLYLHLHTYIQRMDPFWALSARYHRTSFHS